MPDYIRDLSEDEAIRVRRMARNNATAWDIQVALALTQHATRGFRDMLRRRYGITVRASDGTPRSHEGTDTALGGRARA